MKRALIFGTGEIAKWILPLAKTNYKIVAFIDNDQNKWGGKFKGKPVYNPKRILEIDYDVIIIATIAGLDAVTEQLLNMGIEQEKIVTQLLKNEHLGLELVEYKFSLKDYKDVFSSKDKPGTIIQRKNAEQLFKQLTGKVIEIGAGTGKPYFKDFAINAKEYIKTNINPPNQDFLQIDATDIALEDNSVDGIVCMNVLEHVYDFHKAFNEFYRVLKSGGKLIVSTPFVYAYHAAPNDYCRFTHSFYKERMQRYENLKIYQIGNRFSVIAQQLQTVYPSGKRVGVFTRLIAALFLKVSTYFSMVDNIALLYTAIGTKRGNTFPCSFCFNRKHMLEFQESAIINELNNDSICIDAGANVGLISQLFASKGATVHAFEPTPMIFKELEKNVADNVICYQQAVWDKNTKINLYLHESYKEDPLYWSQSSSLFSGKNFISKDDYVEVDAIDLVEFIEKLGKPIDILKIDIEGAEYDILIKLIHSDVYKKIKHILVETHAEKIPGLEDKAKIVDSLIKERNIKNIDLGWV